MPRYIALLRAINVGGHTVSMDALRALFQELGFAEVATFIASGNVIFSSPEEDAAALERRIEEHLEAALGYKVRTFLRTDAELAAVAAHPPFPAAELEAGGSTLYVAFLPAAPGAEARERLLARRNEVDDFRFGGRELYWLCRVRSSDSEFSGALLERLLGVPSTMRNANTVRRLAAKYPAGPAAAAPDGGR